MNRPKFYIFLPLLFALVLLLGFFLGNSFNLNKSIRIITLNAFNKYDKIEEVLRYIQEEYVDTVNNEQLVEKTIVSMLKNLDPHSNYISADELLANNEPLKGNFEGIGIEFNIVEDTICVIAAIPRGPAESGGIKAGDKIIKVEGEIVAGVNIKNKDVLEKLKGKNHTKVKLTVYRSVGNELLTFTITRGIIPLYSIDVAYMVSNEIGYVKINRFAATTHEEYLEAFAKLKKQGLQQLIIDLRGNGGGYLSTAVDIADEFLAEGLEIVYTEGNARPRKSYKASNKGGFEAGKLCILIDDNSASASEILAGAIQDNDRGVIVGRKSFGKGLVQEQSEFSDGSAMRLTIARYYTPTGRCIQKSYSDGTEAYFRDDEDRNINTGQDSLSQVDLPDSLKFITPAGKIVYGGGGISPDVFVPIDTAGYSNYLSEITYGGLINDFAFAYADKERKKLNSFKTFQNFNKSFEITPKIFDAFVAYTIKNKVVAKAKQVKTSKEIIKTQLKALIARNIWSNEGYFPVVQSADKLLKKAIEVLNKEGEPVSYKKLKN